MKILVLNYRTALEIPVGMTAEEAYCCWLRSEALGCESEDCIRMRSMTNEEILLEWGDDEDWTELETIRVKGPIRVEGS